jgi:hypothetical protein
MVGFGVTSIDPVAYLVNYLLGLSSPCPFLHNISAAAQIFNITLHCDSEVHFSWAWTSSTSVFKTLLMAIPTLSSIASSFSVSVISVRIRYLTRVLTAA